MTTMPDDRQTSRRAGTLRFTPAEWKALLEDETFLRDPDNSCSPRRLMGLPVVIVPDHWSAVVLSLAVLAAAPAFAQDQVVIATASAAPLPAAAAPPGPLAPSAEADAPLPDRPSPDNRWHGMVEVSIGTGGSRRVGADVEGPGPGPAELAVAAGVQAADTRRGRQPAD